jgi:hypothetical protein
VSGFVLALSTITIGPHSFMRLNSATMALGQIDKLRLLMMMGMPFIPLRIVSQ